MHIHHGATPEPGRSSGLPPGTERTPRLRDEASLGATLVGGPENLTVSPTLDLKVECASGSGDAVIFDVDGTLCDVRSIRRFVERAPADHNFKADFHRFHSESLYSPAHDAVVQFLRRCRANGLTVLIVSGREARWHELTATWLAKHEVEYDEMYLRPLNDYRPDAVIKAEMRQEITRRYEPRLAVDDRAEIIEVWQAASIPTSQVTERGELMPIRWPCGLERNPRLEALLAAGDFGAK